MTKNVPAIFGCMVFNDDVMRERLPKDVYKSLAKTIDTGRPIDASIADIVATAMKDWAIEKGATHYTHWFLSLGCGSAEKRSSRVQKVLALVVHFLVDYEILLLCTDRIVKSLAVRISEKTQNTKSLCAYGIH